MVLALASFVRGAILVSARIDSTMLSTFLCHVPSQFLYRQSHAEMRVEAVRGDDSKAPVRWRGAPVPPQSHEMRTAGHIVDALASQYTVLQERVPLEFRVQVDVSAPRLSASSRKS